MHQPLTWPVVVAPHQLRLNGGGLNFVMKKLRAFLMWLTGNDEVAKELRRLNQNLESVTYDNPRHFGQRKMIITGHWNQ